LPPSSPRLICFCRCSLMNTALILCYDGTNYHGWQSQKNAPTVQDTLERAVLETTGVDIRLSGCGRTDAGVHARRYVASFRGEHAVPLERLPAALNGCLPGDISVLSAHEMDEGFDARFCCRKKEYAYVIARTAVRNPFYLNYAYQYGASLDLNAMGRAARRFEGTRDFAAVRSEGTPVRSTVRTVYGCRIICQDEFIEMRICADGFLYNMVRTIAGTVLLCGRGKLAPEDVEGILGSRDRAAAGPTLPACGLYLVRLWYDEEVLCASREEDRRGFRLKWKGI